MSDRLLAFGFSPSRGLAALAGYAVFSRFNAEVIAATTAVAAGAILAMLADTMMPEAFEEAHDLAVRVLKEHMDQLHRISGILIERETIDKDQFERLLAGETPETVFPEESPAPEAQPDAPKPRAEPKPRPFPLPGATMQPPEPEAS